MKTITKKDNVSILFREWFDKTYHDATIYRLSIAFVY